MMQVLTLWACNRIIEPPLYTTAPSCITTNVPPWFQSYEPTTASIILVVTSHLTMRYMQWGCVSRFPCVLACVWKVLLCLRCKKISILQTKQKLFNFKKSNYRTKGHHLRLGLWCRRVICIARITLLWAVPPFDGLFCSSFYHLFLTSKLRAIIGSQSSNGVE